MQSIEVLQLAERRSREEIELIDVRIPTEFRELHVVGARNVPLESLDPRAIMTDRNGAATQPLYLICRSGNRSVQAVRKFNEAGFENVIDVQGGVLAWDQAGLPVKRGKKALPLIQQVQLTAGFLVLLGVLLASVVDPAFILLSALVGAGLMFAGATGICPMASLIARMPWNQVAVAGSCSTPSHRPSACEQTI